ncbi:MAG: protein kinase [Armatimonadota bacterium]|nr:protein kinase [bacterium]
MIGQIINHRYEVLEKIGDGPIFSVYKSRDKVLNRLVALKVLSKEVAGGSECVDAILGGYRNVAGLSHPNIARILDADYVQNECFVACEFARGINVKDRVRRAGPIAALNALDIITPVLTALEYAHANRIVHGDIAPQDIIVSPDGEVKLTDFGLFPAVSGCTAVSDKCAMRSVHYQAPEIAEGAAPSPSSDVYSIGVIIYEMLTGQLPFAGATAISVALKKAKEIPTPPRSVNTAIPKSLSDIVMRAMETAPQDRYQSISALLADIKAVSEALRTGRPVIVGGPHAAVAKEPADVPDQTMKSRFIWLVVVFVAVVLVSLGLTMFLSGGKAQVRVPPLLGKTWEEAQFIAQENNIKLVDDGRAFSETYAAGQICAVSPAAGAMVPADSPEVKVKISTGPSTVEIPDLTGLPEARANETAVHAGFTIGNVKQEYSDKSPMNTVISQDPPAGIRRAPGAAIDLVISNGPKPESESDSSSESASSESRSHRYKVNVEVPADADGDQEVQIVVVDDHGETTAYQETRQPGDKFSEIVTAYGSSPTIKIYVGGELVKDITMSESDSRY